MSLPIRFKSLIEMDASSVPLPDEARLSYTVCGRHTDSCGWHGWSLLGAWQEGEEVGDGLMVPPPGPRCPKCGKRLVIIGVDAWMSRSDELGFEYDVEPAEYTEDPDRLLAEQWLGAGLEHRAWRDRNDDACDGHANCNICFKWISDDDGDEHEAMSDGSFVWICFECWEP